MLAQFTAAVIVLAASLLGAGLGLGRVARHLIATGLALALATYLAPPIAAALKAWLPYALVWFVASLLLFAVTAMAANKTLLLFAQGFSCPRWLSRLGGALLMAAVGALFAGMLLWALQLTAGLNQLVLQAPVARAEGIYQWAGEEVAVLTHTSLRASGVSAPVAASVAKVAREPSFYLQQLVNLAMSPELTNLWADHQAQALMQQQDDAALLAQPSAQQLLQQPAAQDLLALLPGEQIARQRVLIQQVRKLWNLRQQLMLDVQLQALLADGSLVDQLNRRDLLGLFANPHWRPFIQRVEHHLLGKAVVKPVAPEFPQTPPESVIPQ